MIPARAAQAAIELGRSQWTQNTSADDTKNHDQQIGNRIYGKDRDPLQIVSLHNKV